MRRDPRCYLYDIQQAVRAIQEFIEGLTYADYERSLMVRSAVERQVTIIGEALTKLASAAPEVAAGVGGHRRVIAFRNVVVHEYADIDDRLVWEILRDHLPQLDRDVTDALGAG